MVRTSGRVALKLGAAFFALLLISCSNLPDIVPVEYSSIPNVIPSPELPPSAPMHAPNISRVAVLAPLTGADAELGRALVNAAQLALFDMSRTPIELLPRDSGNSDASAVEAARIAAKDGARLIIGPLRASQTRAVQASGVMGEAPVLSLSNDANAAAPHTYIMGFMPETETRAVLQAARTRGMKKIALLAPSNVYGDAVTRAALSFDPAIDVLRYAPNETEAVANALTTRDFEAVMIADGGAPLRSLLGALRAQNILPAKQLLGTGLWDDPLVLNDPNAKGALIPSSDIKKWRRFSQSYERIYKQKPPRLASLAYDATALAATLARQPGAGNPYSFDAFHNPAGFSGIDGVFSFDRDGRIVRNLTVRIVGQN